MNSLEKRISEINIVIDKANKELSIIGKQIGKRAMEITRDYLCDRKYHNLGSFSKGWSSKAYPQALNNKNLFDISYDKKTIVNAGFSPNCRAVICVKEHFVIARIIYLSAFISEHKKAITSIEQEIKEIEIAAAEVFIHENQDAVNEILTKHGDNSKGWGVVSFFAHNKGCTFKKNIFKEAYNNHKNK